MDLPLEEAVARLNSFPEYQPMFKDAFGADTVTSAFMLKAFSQYTLRLISANSKYDKYILGLEGGSFSEAELRGLDAFRQNCASCHVGELFTDQSYRNNGLDSTFRDLGRAVITELEEDHGKFRVPSLRNLERTAPYMQPCIVRHFSSLKPSLPSSNEEGVQIAALPHWRITYACGNWIYNHKAGFRES